MVAINFASAFAAAVESGRKHQTIRQTRRCEPGAALQLYTGQRTKECRKLGDATCSAVVPVRIDRLHVLLFADPGPKGTRGEVLSGPAVEAFAKADGFDSYDQMAQWFEKTHGALPFDGWLISWEMTDA